MEERTQKQEKTDEEQARDRAELVEFQYAIRDLVSRLGTVLSSLVVFSSLLYLAGILHAGAYFFTFGASWLVWELPGNSFPFRALPQAIIFIGTTAFALWLVYEGSKKKCPWVMNLISQHKPHKYSAVGLSLSAFCFFLINLFSQTPRFPLPWMVAHPYYSYGLTFLWMFICGLSLVVIVQRGSSRWIYISSYVLGGSVVVLTWLVLSFWTPIIGLEGWIAKIFMAVWGIFFGIGLGIRVLADLTHSNGVFLLKDPIPSPRGGWSAANIFPFYMAFFVWLSLFSLTDGGEQSLYDRGAGHSTLPIVVLKEGNPSCRHALLITSSRVYTVTLQSLPLIRRPDVVSVSWEDISQIQAPEFGKCLDSLLSNDGSVPTDGSVPVPF